MTLLSVEGINKRLDNLLHDKIFISKLTLFAWSSNDLIHRFDDSLIDEFCLKILPQIHHKIKWLNLELSSIEQFLLGIDYPHLYGVGLYNMNIRMALYFFKGFYSLFHIFQKQISSIIITFENKSPRIAKNTVARILIYILNMFKNLYYLNFQTSFVCDEQLSLNELSLRKQIFSETLLELFISVQNFDDCIYLFDGRFNKLHTIYINVSIIHSNQLIDNKEKLCNLKCFSLTSDVNTSMYDELVVPLVRRMSYLEQLSLYLQINHNNTFIDGNDLKNNILDYLLYLKKFKFNIHSFIFIDNLMNLPSNEDVRRTLSIIGNEKFVSSVNYYPHSQMASCNIYSYSCTNTMKYYYNITNNFPGGLFRNVKKVLLFDECPFEHEFFIQISKSFPVITNLSLNNQTPQKKKNHEQRFLSVVEFSHLSELYFDEAHDD
ncbi:unnamed protein product, partial [Rotaria sp. Silwood2]